MILAARRFGIEQINAAFLAAGDHQFAPFVIEDRRSDLHIEIAFLQPDQLEGMILVFDLQFIPSTLAPISPLP